MLAFGSRAKCPTDLLAFFLFLVANSSKESRKRLVRIITHPSAQPLSVQLLLGQRVWSAAMFDEIRSIDLDNLESAGDFATAYIGVARCLQDGDYIYSGSATGLNRTQDQLRLRGEAQRMYGHRAVLALGHDEIIRRRTARRGAALFMHEKMSLEGSRYSLIPAVRFSIDGNRSQQTQIKAAALALFSENCNALLLAGKPRSQNTTPSRWWTDTSRAILDIVRPDDFPEPSWYSGNLALPLLQTASPIWQMVKDLTPTLTRTPFVDECLRNHFLKSHDRYLSRSTSMELLSNSRFSFSTTNYYLLVEIYKSILQEHGLVCTFVCMWGAFRRVY